MTPAEKMPLGPKEDNDKVGRYRCIAKCILVVIFLLLVVLSVWIYHLSKKISNKHHHICKLD